MRKIVQGINLTRRDLDILTAYKKDLCGSQAIEDNLSHTVRQIIRNPQAYAHWLTEHVRKESKHSRSKVAAS